MSWLKSIRKATKGIKDGNTFKEVVTNIRKTKTAIKNIDDVFNNLPFVLKNNELVVNGKRWRLIQADLRVGNIRKALNEIKIPNNITVADEATFKKIFTSQVPEIKLNKIKERINASKRFHSDLDITGLSVNEIKTTLKNLSPKSKVKLEASYKTIFKVAGGIGTTAVGVYAAIKFTNNIYDDLARATKERDGCFLVCTLDGVTSSCKLIHRSCGVESGKICKSELNERLPYNINIMLHHFIKNNDTSSLKEIESILNIRLDHNNIGNVLTQTNNVNKLHTYYKENFSNKNVAPFSDPCGLYNKTSGCIACDSSATVNSELYVDDSELAVNYSLQCVRHSTVLETLVEISENMALDIFNAATSNSIGRGNLLTYLFMLLTTLLFISLGLKFLRNPNKKEVQNLEIEPLLFKNGEMQS